jgi:thioredoxin 1
MIELTKETFDEQVLQSAGKVLVDFYGDGCAPCEALKPHVHKLEEEYGGKLKFTALNTSKARRLAISQQILGLPVIAVYENGVKLKELVKDDATPENVAAMLAELLA